MAINGGKGNQEMKEPRSAGGQNEDRAPGGHRSLILHIGTKKTGSTSIQTSLRKNAGNLGKIGIHVPERFGQFEAKRLVNMIREAPAKGLDESEMEAFHREVDQRFDDGTRMTVLSSESLVDLGEASIARLRQELGRIFDDIRVVLYIRRQDLCATSHYSTAIAGGGVSKALISDRLGRTRRSLDYLTLTTEWGRQFGEDNLDVRTYERDHLIEGDVVADFFAAIGVADGIALKVSAPTNVALSAENLAFLRLLNEVLRRREDLPEAEAKRCRETAMRILRRNNTGRSAKPARETARAYYDRYREDNEIVRKRWFPSQPHLFTEDFSMYPETGDDLDAIAMPATLMNIMATVIVHMKQGK